MLSLLNLTDPLAMAFKQPILLGGLGLSATLWLLQTVHISLFDSSTLLSAMALATGLWWWRHRDPLPVSPRPIAPPLVDRSRVEAALTRVTGLIASLAAESGSDSSSVTGYSDQAKHILAELDRVDLRLAVVGDRHTGKTTLVEALTLALGDGQPAARGPSLTELALIHDGPPPDPLTYDGVLLVTDGDLTDSSFSWLQQRLLTGQGAVLVFTKTDHYSPADRQTLIDQLQQRVQALPAPVPVVAVAVAPRPTKVRRHQADGRLEECLEPSPVVLEPLPQVVRDNLLAAQANLVAATALRQAEALADQVQTDLNQVRRQRALPLVEQLQWVAGAAAFANPVPSLDLLATVAINGQLIMDLGQLYGFNLSLDQAKVAAGTLAGLTVKLGLVEISSQALTAVLKSHFATYLAAGTVQGLSAAYLTRMAGLTLIDYFERAALAGTPATALSWSTIAQHLQEVIGQNRQPNLLTALVNQGLSILRPSPAALGPAPVTLEAQVLAPALDSDRIPA
jgi:GTPase SAR1 family protein